MTDVPWATKAWHVVRGCTKVSRDRGCENCFACRLAATRLKNRPAYAGLAHNSATGPRWSGKVRCYLDELMAPLRRRKPTVYFVAEMGDLFHEKVPFEFIAAVFGVMAATPRHTYLLLTKRPERMAEWYHWVSFMRGVNTHTGESEERPIDPLACCHMKATAHGVRFGPRRIGTKHPAPSWPLPNVWPGTSAEGQPELDERAPVLLRAPVHEKAGHWLSLEPQLEAVDATRYLVPLGSDEHEQCAPWCGGCGKPGPRPPLKGVIQGCEGGPGRRTFDVDWAISMQKQCEEAGVHYYLKQIPGPGKTIDKEPTLYGCTWRQLPWEP